MYRKTYVEINIDNLKSNVENIRKYYNEYKYFFGVVKGNGYGHGVKNVVNELINSGINYLAVSNLEEALEIREVNKNIPILCLEPICIEYINICEESNITIMVHNTEYVNELIKKENKLKVHIKIDSGMNRLGFKDEKEFDKAYNLLRNKKNIEIEGIFSHFATIGINDKEWDNQLNKFKQITKNIELSKIPIVHLTKSASFMAHSKIDFANGIRIGIALYGYNPIPLYSNKGIKNKLRNIKRAYIRKKLKISDTIKELPIELKPAFKMKTEILQIKDIKKGEFVGYGASYRAKEDERIAILAVGYDDGIFRSSKNRDVSINNKRYSFIGDICMGMSFVKIDDKVKNNSVVTVIGDAVPISYVARHNNTTIYETLCNIGKNIPRVYIKNGEVISIEKA